MDFSSIQDIDFQILQWFNGSNNVILEQLVMALTSGFTWIPLYLVLFIIVMRNNETIGQIGLIVGCAFLCILFADGIAEGIIQHHHQHRTDKRLLIPHLIKQASRLRTIEQIAQEEGEGDERCQGVLGSGNLREEGYLQGTLTLTVDGGEEAHYKIDECQEQKWSCTLECYRLFHKLQDFIFQNLHGTLCLDVFHQLLVKLYEMRSGLEIGACKG